MFGERDGDVLVEDAVLGVLVVAVAVLGVGLVAEPLQVGHPVDVGVAAGRHPRQHLAAGLHDQLLGPVPVNILIEIDRDMISKYKY